MLVIQALDKHSYGVTIPDRFIGVDDLDSPRSTPVICGNVVWTTGVPPCLLWFPADPNRNTHSIPPKWAPSLISIGAKSIARQSGERGSTTRPIGRSSRWA